MKLEIRNVAKFEDARIEVKGITVIAGVNATGKSTLGKSLFTVFNSFFGLERFFRETRVEFVCKELMWLFGHPYLSKEFQAVAERLTDEWETKKELDLHFLRANVESLSQKGDATDETALAEAHARIVKSLSLDDEVLLKGRIARQLRSEFKGQLAADVEQDSSMAVLLRAGRIGMRISSDGSVEVDGNAVSLRNRAVYVDDPSIFDRADEEGDKPFREAQVLGHRDALYELLRISVNTPLIAELMANVKIAAALRELDSVCNGSVELEKNEFQYTEKGGRVALKPANISAGLKTFLILKRLLSNGGIHQNGTLILDEPEIHLHPAWQLVFAEILVLLQKEFGLHVMLTTHSPYFLKALEVYSRKYGVFDSCRFYRSSTADGRFVVEDVDSDTERIYADLAQPLRDLQRVGDAD